jgi:hypothetical protein
MDATQGVKGLDDELFQVTKRRGTEATYSLIAMKRVRSVTWVAFLLL